MKILLHAITGLSTGGAEKMLYRLVSSLQQHYQQAVLSMLDEGTVGPRIMALGVPVYTLGMTPGIPSLKALRRCARVIATVRPDLVQGWMYHADLAALLAAWLSHTHTPVLWNVRASLDLRREKRSTAAVIRLGALLSRCASGIIYNAHSSARQHEALGYTAARTRVIPNGFDCSEFKPDPGAKRWLRESLGIGMEEILIGCVGRFHPMKDHRGFLAAAAMASRREPRLRFVLVGHGLDVSNAELSAWILEEGLSGRVHLLGRRDDMPRITAGIDAACLASAWGEGFPNVLGEAMACAVPCITTDIGDSAWVVGNTGKVVSARSPQAMAEAMLALEALGAEGREALGARARQRVLENFSLDAVAQQYKAYYDQIAHR